MLRSVFLKKSTLLATCCAAASTLPSIAMSQDRCEVERVNKNGESIGDPSCPDRGDLTRLGGGKDSQSFLVLSQRAPDGTFSLQSQNAAFDTG